MKFIYINIILTFIMICGLIFFTKWKKIGNIKKNTIDKYYKKIVILLFILVIFTSIYKLMSIPNGIMVDEAGMYYDARLIARFGYDRYFNRFPVYLVNFGGGQGAMYAYLVALLIKIFGNHLILMRIPQVLFRIISFISAYYLVKNDDDKLKRLVFLSLFAIIPFFIMESRWGLDCNLLFSFMTISTSLFFNAIIKNNNRLLFISGIFWGLTLYTYALSYIIIPLFLIITFIYLLYIKKINIKKIIIVMIPIIILAIPLVLMILVNNGIINEIKSFITIPKLPLYRGSEISILNILPSSMIIFYMLSFDEIIYNSIPSFGNVYYVSIPFFIMGLIIIIKNIKYNIKSKKNILDYIMFIWFISVLICMLLIDKPNANRANAIFVPLIYIITIGIIKFIKNNKYMFRLIIIIYAISYIMFLGYYFIDFNKEFSSLPTFVPYYIESLDYVKNIEKENVYINPSFTQQPDIYLYLLDDMDPKGIKKDEIQSNGKKYYFKEPDEIDDNTVYITNSIHGYDMDYKQIGDMFIINGN